MSPGGDNHGFADMDPEKQREIASMGGKASAESRRGGGAEEEYQGGGGRGFASMDPDRQREIASKGGKVAQAHRTHAPTDAVRYKTA